MYGYKIKDIKIVNIHELLMQQTWTSMKSEVCTLAKIKIKEECQNEKNICKEISQTMKISQFLDFFLVMTILSFSIRKRSMLPKNYPSISEKIFKLTRGK
jgi:hypothetical protein